jgi:hypothetical protein
VAAAGLGLGLLDQAAILEVGDSLPVVQELMVLVPQLEVGVLVGAVILSDQVVLVVAVELMVHQVQQEALVLLVSRMQVLIQGVRAALLL